MLAALACTCGPVTGLLETGGTLGAAQGTLQSAVTELGPTVQAGLTQVGPTLMAEATNLAGQATLRGPELNATMTAVAATADAAGSSSFLATAQAMATSFAGGNTAQPGNTIRQWASGALASSEYDNPEWAALQAMGPPDTGVCADKSTAWASLVQGGREWLQLSYSIPVIPVEINIYETYNPGTVYLVEVIDEAGRAHEVWSEGPSLAESPCPAVTSISTVGVTYPITGVIIHVDQTAYNDWAEIDAVELVGLTP
jgi:hypothetical protein